MLSLRYFLPPLAISSRPARGPALDQAQRALYAANMRACAGGHLTSPDPRDEGALGHGTTPERSAGANLGLRKSSLVSSLVSS
jgi:hypothetical protein